MVFTYTHTRRTCYTAYFAQAVGNCFLPLLFIIFQTNFYLTYQKLGTLILLNFFTQLIVDIIAVRFADRVGYRKLLVLANVFCFVGFAMISAAPIFDEAYLGLVIAVVLYAIGGGLLELLVSPVIDSLPTKKEHKAAEMSLLHAIFCWGQLIVIVVTTVFLNFAGYRYWQLLPVLWSMIPLYNIVMFLKVPFMPTVTEEKRTPIRKLFAHTIFIVSITAMISAGAAELIMAQWASLFAEDGLGLSKVWGDLAGPGMFAIAMGIGRTLYGIFGTKIKLTLVMIIGSLGCIVCYLLAGIPDNPMVNIVACAMLGFFVSPMWPGVISITAGNFANGGIAMFGLLAVFGDVGGALGPWISGILADRLPGGLKAGILPGVIFPIILLIAVIIYQFMERKRSG